MATQEFNYKGRTLEQLKDMSIEEFTKIVPSRQRRSLRNGLNHSMKTVLENVKKGDKNIKTHCRDMVVLPQMVGSIIKVHNGKEFVPITITVEMLGHFLGEYALTRRRVTHNAPGIGSTRSSASVSVR
jgi:small subunit ribosomal protein S19